MAVKIELGDGKATVEREIEGAHEMWETSLPARDLRAEGPERAALRRASRASWPRRRSRSRSKDAAALGPRRRGPRAEDAASRRSSCRRRAPAVQDDRGRRGHPGQGAAAAAPRRSEGDLMAAILTFAEQRDGKLRRAVARGGLARRGGWPTRSAARVETVLVGPGQSTALAGELAAYGADRVHVFDDAGARARTRPSPTRARWRRSIAEAKPTVVLVPFTAHGQGPGAARGRARRRRPRLRLRGARRSRTGGWRRAGPMYAGKAFATVALGRASRRWRRCGRTCSRSGTPDASRKAEVVTRRRVDTAPRAQRDRGHGDGAGKVELTEAQIIVSGGRGLKGPENFHLVESLAAALGRGGRRLARGGGRRLGRPPATRSARRARPCRRRSTSRRASAARSSTWPGMSSSKVHRRDQQGPRRADLQGRGLRHVGDVFEILPKLTEAAKAHKASRG